MKQLESNNLTMVDLFCGAGVGAIGFKHAGYNIIDAIDNAKYAVKAYNENIGNHARVENIKTIKSSEIKKADVYVATPPCKSFSTAGNGLGERDPKTGDLFEHTLHIIKDNKPKAFLLENVKGLTFKKNEKFFNTIISELSNMGYNVTWKITDCWEYGVPQIRERVFIIGIRNDLNKFFRFPKTIECENSRPTLKDAIYDLGVPSQNSPFKNHSEFVQEGYSSRYKSRNRQRQWHEPSFSIVSQAKHLPLHPTPSNFDVRVEKDMSRVRRLTVRECLRIQSVPDTFAFCDSIQLSKQYERCSGIPSLIAYKFGIELAKTLKK